MNRKNILIQNISQVQNTTSKFNQSQQPPKIVAVTKTVDSQIVRELYQLGLNHFGENRPDELVNKMFELKDLRPNIQWHFIGQLQSRQVKKIINDIDFLHSLDRMSLAKEIQKRADQPIQAFLQVNVSGEESKSGFEPRDLLNAVKEMAQYDKINIIGLMTMAPIDASEEDLHYYFNELKQLQLKVKEKEFSHAPCSELSMGMSRDYPIAVQEGATYIRVGTTLYEGL